MKVQRYGPAKVTEKTMDKVKKAPKVLLWEHSNYMRDANTREISPFLKTDWNFFVRKCCIIRI